MTASEEEKQVTSQAKAARDAALKEASSVQGRYKALEDELQGLREELAKEVRDRQAKEEDMKAWEAAIGDRRRADRRSQPTEDSGAEAEGVEGRAGRQGEGLGRGSRGLRGS